MNDSVREELARLAETIRSNLSSTELLLIRFRDKTEKGLWEDVAASRSQDNADTARNLIKDLQEMQCEFVKVKSRINGLFALLRLFP